MKKTIGLVLVLVLALFSSVFADRKAVNEGLSPYFFVSGDGKVDSFPLLSTDVNVNIAGMTAEVELRQVYKNDGSKTLEAVYVFPLGTKSAIHAMRMKIGSRIIEADIHETGLARQIYEEAKNTGRTASLLEQKRPNVFQMNVANIMPGDKVEVTINYCEALVPEKGVYEYVHPAVVGPRFTGESSASDLKGKDNWAVNPYLHEGKQAPDNFNLKMNIKSGIPVAKVWSNSHKVETDFENKNSVKITLLPKEARGLTKDFCLKYSLQGNAINTGILLYPGQSENFFLMMVQPPDKVTMDMIPPREYLFIMDVSGSMNGFPLETSKEVIRKILSNLRGQDYFNIMFFAGSSDTLFPKAFPATEMNKKKALEMINGQQGGGGTEILSAFKKAFELEKKPGMSKIIVTLTDGYVSVEKEVFDLMHERMGEANFFSFGIGSSVNRFIIEGMARAGKGEPFVVQDGSEAGAAAERFIEYIKSPVLTDIKINFNGFEAYDVEPVSQPDLFAQRPLFITGKYKSSRGSITISGKTASGDYKNTMDIDAFREDASNEAVKFLWARERIARLADYGKTGVDVKAEVTKLGLKYSLMTEYTSFVAVDKLVRETGEVVTVKQPLPLPDGVSDLAVGDSAQYVPSVNMGMRTAAPVAEAYASQMHKSKIAIPSYDKAEAVEEKEAFSSAAASAPVYLSNGTTPAGVTLDSVEAAIFPALKNELENYFAKNNLRSAELKLTIENGKIKAVDVVSFDGKRISAKELEKLFNKITFAGVAGTIVITLERL